MRALDRKVFRELRRLRAQLAAIVLVIAAGVGLYLGMTATMHSLESARAAHYAEQRFGHVFASLVRAPEPVARDLRRIPAVQAVQTRVVAAATLDVAGMIEAVSGRLISIPEDGAPAVNDLHLRRGRLPTRGVREGGGATLEAVVHEAFLEAHGLELGTRIHALVRGTRVTLTLVGVGLSPEYTYAVGPGQVFPDDRRFGVFWLRRDALAATVDLDGAFNDVSLRIARDADADAVIARVDDVLDPYGGRGAIPRADQPSAFFLDNDLTQLRAFAQVMPVLFLAVAAFLLQLVFGRLVAGQRAEIAALKAFGYRDREVGAHYAKLLGAVLAIGWLGGLGLAWWLGSSMTSLYVDYYRLPGLRFRLGAEEVLVGLAASLLAAAGGAGAAVRRTVRMAPAEAMRPPAPPTYRPLLLERLGLARLLAPPLRIVLREVERKPVRAGLSVAGVAGATALTVIMAFGMDSIRHMLNLQFGLQQREDVRLTLIEPRAVSALSSVRALPGVLHAEAAREVPVELRAGRSRKRTAVSGIPHDARLVGLLDTRLRDVALPVEGLVLDRKLSRLLGVGAGDTLTMEVLEGERGVHRVPVARVVESWIGTTAAMRLDALCRVLGETPTMNGARLLVDDARLPELHAAVKAAPAVAGIGARDAVLSEVTTMLDENLGTSIAFSLAFALIVAFGVLYNTARITLSERARELATLRVLGFRRAEVARLLVGELSLILLLALPLGLFLGWLGAAALVRSPGFDTEQFRLPLVIAPSTYALAVLTVLGAGLVSGWNAWRRLDRFDLVEVLKTRD